MKFLVIMGSPNGRGSGYRIVRSTELELEKQGDVEFEYLFLKEQKLEPCRGCFLCVRKGEERCPISDDRAHIEETIDAADGVILVSPCYAYNMSRVPRPYLSCPISRRQGRAGLVRSSQARPL